MRVERVDTFSIVLISEAGEALTISNGEFLTMMSTINAGRWNAIAKDVRKDKRPAAKARS